MKRDVKHESAKAYMYAVLKKRDYSIVINADHIPVQDTKSLPKAG